MAITFFSRCEGATLDGTDDFSAGDTTFALSSAAAFNSSGVKVGTNGLNIPTSNDYATIDVASLVTSSEGALGFWIRFASAISSSKQYLTGSGTGGGIYLTGADSGSSNLKLIYTHSGEYSRSVQTAAAGLTTSTWYWVEIGWSVSATSLRLSIYDSSGTLLETASNTGLSFSPGAFTSLTSFSFGDAGGVSATGSFDNIFMGGAYADSFLTSRDITSYTEYGSGGGDEVPAKPAEYIVNTGHAYCPDHLWMLDEGSGTSLVDRGAVGGLNMTLTGADWITDGAHGNVLDFVAANTDYAQVAVSGLTGTHTMCALVYADTVSAQGTIVSLCDSGDFDRYVALVQQADEDLEAISRFDSTAVNNTSTTDIPVGEWSLVWLRFSDTTIDWSLNGAAWTTQAVTHTGLVAALNRLTLGYRNTTSPGNPYDHPIGALMWWKSSLSNAEIADISANPWQFLSTEVLEITGVSNGGVLYTGLTATIDGSAFGDTQGSSTLKLKTADGSPSVTQSPLLWSDTSIEFVVDAEDLPIGSCNIEVVVDGTTVLYGITVDSPPGYANGVVNVPWTAGAESLWESASPALVDGDLYEYALQTDTLYDVEVFPDGTFLVATETGEHTITVRVYDQTDETWSGWEDFVVEATTTPSGELPSESSSGLPRVYALASVTGLRKWVDYLPAAVVVPAANKAGTFDDEGCIRTYSLTDVTGLTAWRDYYPIFLVTPTASKRWRFDDDGWIPVSEA